MRLWDARIGRWLTTDPYGQHAFPYMMMSNSPALHYDPDGGCDQPDSSCGWWKRLFYSSTQIGAWETWQSMGTTGSQEMLNNVTITGAYRTILVSRAMEMETERLFHRQLSNDMGIQNVYEDYDTRFEAFASFFKFVSPNVPNIPRFV